MSLAQWRLNRLREVGRDKVELFHMTHCLNMQSILADGLLPKNALSERPYVDMSLATAQQRRQARRIQVDRDAYVNLHDMVPFFFAPRNPMTYLRRDRAT